MDAIDKSYLWLQHGKINKLVLAVCCFIILATLITAYKAFISSREVITSHISDGNLHLTQSFMRIAKEEKSDATIATVLSKLNKAWHSSRNPGDAGFLCVVNSKGILTLHTGNPDRNGKFVGEKKLHPDNPVTLQALVQLKQDWVGPYLSAAGQEQIAAFSYIPQIDSMVSIHTPLNAINQQIKETTLPWLIGLIFIGGIMFPLSLWLLNIAYRKGRNELNQANVCLNTEVHERRQAELALKQHRDALEDIVNERTHALIQARDDALSATHTKSEFLTNMSHELRTPLNSIIGFTDILRTGQAGAVNQEQTRQITMVNDSARYLLGLINGVLDLSKIESGKIDIEKLSFQFSSFIHEITELFRPQIEAKSLSINLSLIHLDEQHLYTDRSKLEQIIINLIGNAIKFTEEGSIDIRCRKYLGDGIIIEVQDTGIGISTENQELIFGSFQQGDTTTSRKYGGTGLGLAISQQYTKMLGGSLSVESKPGSGSAFYIVLPHCLNEDYQRAV